jgi:hypothetical protein
LLLSATNGKVKKKRKKEGGENEEGGLGIVWWTPSPSSSQIMSF